MEVRTPVSDSLGPASISTVSFAFLDVQLPPFLLHSMLSFGNLVNPFFIPALVVPLDIRQLNIPSP